MTLDDPPLLRAAKYWLTWNEHAEQVATWRYRVEDIPSVFDEFCRRLEKPYAPLILERVSTDVNTRRHGKGLHIVEEMFERVRLDMPTTVRRSLRAVPGTTRTARTSYRDRRRLGRRPECAYPGESIRIRVRAMTARTRPQVLMLIENIGYRQDTRARTIAKSLVSAGYDVSVVCPGLAGDPRREVADGVAVRSFRSWELSRLGILGHIIEYAYCGIRLGGSALWYTARGQADVVHMCVPPHVFFPIGIAVRRLGAKLVVDQHDLTPELFAERYGPDRHFLLWLLKRSERAASEVPIMYS